MKIEEFRKYAHQMVDWMADYYRAIETYPVRSAVRPGDIIKQLPPRAPEAGEPFEAMFRDFEKILLPGITHWQHPSFFAYFNANGSLPSLLGEMLTAALGAQCMSWQTSPAAAELEERVMEWTRRLIGLPEEFTGVIQDTASTATLCALLTARERATGFQVNARGFSGEGPFTVYCSSEAHSSVEKGVKIAGFGRDNLRKIAVDGSYALRPDALEAAVDADLARGFRPLAAVAALGTTSSTAVDPLKAVGEICRRRNLWLHVDAAYAGTALLLPEMRWMIEGIEAADSFVFNPHKWMFTHFDCSAYFVRDREALIRTFEILPEYLKTREDDRVNNYRDWGIQLGRRFRALKLWFVLRSFGAEGLRQKVRDHIRWAGELAEEIRRSGDFQLMAPVPLPTVSFRYAPAGAEGDEELNRLNASLLERLNDTGLLYLTHTKLDGKHTLRLVVGQTCSEKRHIDAAWNLIMKTAREMRT